MSKILYGVEDLQVEILSLDDNKIKYSVTNTPICQYDQHSRARVGVKFLNYKVSNQPVYVFYTALKDMHVQYTMKHTLKELEKLRNNNTIKEDYNLMSRNCSYTVEQDLSSLKHQMARRLKFCEEEFIVGLHWKLKYEISKLNPVLALKFRPGCDVIGRCDYSSADYLSNAFGCLFSGCGRWPDKAKYATFNESCTTPELLSKQLNIPIKFFQR